MAGGLEFAQGVEAVGSVGKVTGRGELEVEIDRVSMQDVVFECGSLQKDKAVLEGRGLVVSSGPTVRARETGDLKV